jgi:hypothetical protein
MINGKFCGFSWFSDLNTTLDGSEWDPSRCASHIRCILKLSDQCNTSPMNMWLFLVWNGDNSYMFFISTNVQRFADMNIWVDMFYIHSPFGSNIQRLLVLSKPSPRRTSRRGSKDPLPLSSLSAVRCTMHDLPIRCCSRGWRHCFWAACQVTLCPSREHG